MAVPALISIPAIPRFLDAIRASGVPPKVDANYLKTLGFKNTNDQALIPLFKSLGFLDSQSKPTETFRAYRAAGSEEARGVLGASIMQCYSGLFTVYPDAYRKDDEALTNWLRANIDKGKVTQERALKTFKVLRDSASFEEPSFSPADTNPGDSPKPGETSLQSNHVNRPPHVRTPATPDVTINISLQIAATADATIYDKFFASMRKHLFINEA